MADIYHHDHSVNEHSTFHKLQSIYGPNESCILHNVYELGHAHPNPTNNEPFLPGGFDYERSTWCGEFLELFFKLAFEQSEEWEQLVQSVNATPLLPEFYEAIRSQELFGRNKDGEDLDEFIDKQYIMLSLNKEVHQYSRIVNNDESIITRQQGNRRQGRSILSSLNIPGPNKATTNNVERQVGLFRTYSIRLTDKKHDDDGHNKSVSFTALNNDGTIEGKRRG